MLKKDSAHGVNDAAPIYGADEESADVMLEELSPGVRSDEEQFEFSEGGTPGLESVRKNLDNGNPKARQLLCSKRLE
jgi:hypothetical protein